MSESEDESCPPGGPKIAWKEWRKRGKTVEKLVPNAKRLAGSLGLPSGEARGEAEAPGIDGRLAHKVVVR